MKRWRVVLLQVLCGLGLLGGAVGLQYRFDRPGFEHLRRGRKIKYSKIDEGVHMLPPPHVLKAMAVGLESVLSELLMLESFNYFYMYSFYGKDQGYLNRLYAGITALNPYYFTAYRYGGYFLRGPLSMRTDALRSFKRGVIQLSRPDLSLSSRWMSPVRTRREELLRKEYMPDEQAAKLMLETAIHYFAYLKDNLRGAEVCRCARRLFPRYRRDFMEKEVMLRSEEGQFRMVIEIWKAFVDEHKDDAAKAAVGLYMIKKYGTLARLDALSKRIRAFRERRGKWPEMLDEVAAPEECVDGFGEALLYLEKEGKVFSRVLLREKVEWKRSLFVREVRRWKRTYGMYPRSLEELSAREADRVRLPVGVVFPYNFASGEVGTPPGFGDDVCSLLFLLASAEYRWRTRHGAFRLKGDPRDLGAVFTEDEEPGARLRRLLRMHGNYRFGFIPGVRPFGIYACSPEGETYIVRGCGPVLYRKGRGKVREWPREAETWTVIAR